MAFRRKRRSRVRRRGSAGRRRRRSRVGKRSMSTGRPQRIGYRM